MVESSRYRLDTAPFSCLCPSSSSFSFSHLLAPPLSPPRPPPRSPFLLSWSRPRQPQYKPFFPWWQGRRHRRLRRWQWRRQRRLRRWRCRGWMHRYRQNQRWWGWLRRLAGGRRRCGPVTEAKWAEECQMCWRRNHWRWHRRRRYWRWHRRRIGRASCRERVYVLV